MFMGIGFIRMGMRSVFFLVGVGSEGPWRGTTVNGVKESHLGIHIGGKWVGMPKEYPVAMHIGGKWTGKLKEYPQGYTLGGNGSGCRQSSIT
ncbi:hypothetical protein SAMN05518847_104147 [Paenibacillus sp. OV219]|nr:hypothetical protein SAMN05518847_104147 [Paenibacillus sp. OV219]